MLKSKNPDKIVRYHSPAYIPPLKEVGFTLYSVSSTSAITFKSAPVSSHQGHFILDSGDELLGFQLSQAYVLEV
ncbi:MAG: hypothetical protein DCF15_01320 [Phormidesmis priestleyi]|uniref:Uncharacterized protein n=1 Tax=Phormidesmis priestleyi TaxID=268141 RepID=A0A2W4XYG2_9CYAN|nr:MAG: hypothetical protein DCF15_01320 [Phormidesmis priestleyi]